MFFFFKQKTAYEMRISDWSSDVCSSDLALSSSWPASARRQAAAVRRAWPADQPADHPVLYPRRLGRTLVRESDQAGVAGLQADPGRPCAPGHPPVTESPMIRFSVFHKPQIGRAHV